MYSVKLKNIVPKRGLTCLFAKATSDQSKLWHRRLGHINFKTMNKLVRGNLVRGLPSKLFENDQTCVACQMGKQHRASYKSKTLWIYETLLGVCSNSYTIDNFGSLMVRLDDGFFVGDYIYCYAFDVFNILIYELLFDGFLVIMVFAGKYAGDEDGLDCWEAACSGIFSSPDAGFKPLVDNEKKVTEEPRKEGGDPSNKNDSVNNTNNINTSSDGNITNNVNAVSSSVNAAGIEVNVVGVKTSIKLLDDPNMPKLEDIVYSDDAEDVGTEADIKFCYIYGMSVPFPTTRIHKVHPVEQIIGS
ncbi:putative ribonuclease H-like domain-containing protein [Tanacetum coccineum]